MQSPLSYSRNRLLWPATPLLLFCLLIIGQWVNNLGESLLVVDFVDCVVWQVAPYNFN